MKIAQSLKAMFNPAAVIDLLRLRLEENLKKEINEFQLVYHNESDSLFFIIDNKSHDFLADSVKSLIKTKLVNSTAKDELLHSVIIDIDKDNNCNGTINFIKDNKKQFRKFKF